MLYTYYFNSEQQDSSVVIRVLLSPPHRWENEVWELVGHNVCFQCFQLQVDPLLLTLTEFKIASHIPVTFKWVITFDLLWSGWDRYYYFYFTAAETEAQRNKVLRSEWAKPEINLPPPASQNFSPGHTRARRHWTSHPSRCICHVWVGLQVGCPGSRICWELTGSVSETVHAL